jgi:hypothetical protein
MGSQRSISSWRTPDPPRRFHHMCQAASSISRSIGTRLWRHSGTLAQAADPFSGWIRTAAGGNIRSMGLPVSWVPHARVSSVDVSASRAASGTPAQKIGSRSRRSRTASTCSMQLGPAEKYRRWLPTFRGRGPWIVSLLTSPNGRPNARRFGLTHGVGQQHRACCFPQWEALLSDALTTAAASSPIRPCLATTPR